jgi:transcriptional regulator with XRE-family HTH domain
MKKSRSRAGPTPFAKILRSLMTEKSLTVRAAASIAGVSPSTIDDWRAGAMPADYLAVRKLANGLGVSLSFILTGEDEVRQPNILPSVTEVFDDGGSLYDGYAKITIQRLIPRKKMGEEK